MGLSPEDFDRLVSDELQSRRDQHLLRRRVEIAPLDAAHVEIDGRRFVNFCSNNYLGLTTHPRLLAAVEGATRQAGFGSGAAALVSGYTPIHASAERALAKWKGTESAVLLPSGYQANHAAVQTLTALGDKRRGVRFLVDKLVHASILDAVRAPERNVRVFPHNGLSKLRRLLADGEAGVLDVVVTESIFSMDGDAADLDGLAELKREHPFVLLLDEAHGSGVYGSGGSGYAAERGLQKAVDLSVVTLSKALGGIGGAICGGASLCDAVVNLGRAFIFSTSLPAAAAAAAEAAVEVMRDEPQRQHRVRALARRVRDAMAGAGVALPQGDSPIVPVIFGSETLALAATESLKSAGLLVAAVRPPTIPRGTSRLRITLSSAHADEEVDRLVASVLDLVNR